MTDQAGLLAAEAADPWALPETPVLPRRSRRRATIFAAIGLLAYCGGLIASIPASVVLPKSDRWQVGGTIWNGDAVIAATTRLEWHWSAPASLSRLAFTANWHLTGGDTDLIGSASPGIRQLRLDGVSGVADGTLLNLAAPNLPVTCRFLAQVSLERVVVGGSDQQAAGSLRTSPVHCAVKAPGVANVLGAVNALSAAALDLPALHGHIGPAPASATPGLRSGALFTLPSHQHLLEARLYSNGNFSLWPTAALTARVPVLAGTRLDTTLHW